MHLLNTPSFRVELCEEGRVTILCEDLRDVFPHHCTLAPFISRLIEDRGTDQIECELTLIDSCSNLVVARRMLSATPTKSLNLHMTQA